MKTRSIKHRFLIAALLSTSMAFGTGHVLAGEDQHGQHPHSVHAEVHDMHGNMHADASGATSANAASEVKQEMTSGEVKKLMVKRGKISIKHEEIKSLDMPPMTMVFKVKDPAMLEGLVEGDQIEFSVDKDMVIEALKKR